MKAPHSRASHHSKFRIKAGSDNNEAAFRNGQISKILTRHAGVQP
jgi:hypothetical protein